MKIQHMIIVCILLVSLQPSVDIGFDDSVTHPSISEKAINDYSNLSEYMKGVLGLPKGLDSRFPSDSQDPSVVGEIWLL